MDLDSQNGLPYKQCGSDMADNDKFGDYFFLWIFLGICLPIIFDNIVCSISLSVISMVLFTYLLVSIKKKRRFDQNQISPLAYTDHSDLLAEYQQHHQ